MTAGSRRALSLSTAMAVLWALWATGAAVAATNGGDVIVEPSPCASACEEQPEIEGPSAPDPERSILVIGVGWDSGTPTTSSSLAKHELGSYVDYISGHVNEWFMRAAQNRFRPWQVTSGGEYTIAAPKFASADPESCEKGRFIGEVGDRAEAAVRQAGINPDAYAVVAIEWEPNFCGFEGIRSGRRIGLSSPALVPMHELGHFLGLGHANSVVCHDAGGAAVPLSANCETPDVYGDLYDSMGEGTGSFSAPSAAALGWMDPSQFISLGAGLITRTVTLRPWTGPDHENRALRLREGATTLWLEYRLPIGIDTPGFNTRTFAVHPGLIVHREGPLEGGEPIPTTELLDMTPTSEAGFADAGLPVGQTWANPLGTMKIRLDSSNSLGATVTVSSQLVKVPNVVGGDRKAAVTAIGAAGLHFAGSTNKNTTNCDEIGKVIAVQPAAGTGLFPGSDVTVTIGEGNRSQICQ